MSSETLQLLKAFIDCMGCDIEELGTCNIQRYKVTKKPKKPRAKAKAEGYSEDFIKLWSKYPKGHSGSKAKTFRLFNTRLKESKWINPADEVMLMEEGLDRYIPYLEATGISPKSSETFFGRDRHYMNEFAITKQAKQKNKLKLPFDNESLEQFAKNNNLSPPGKTDTFDQYRRKLQAEINSLTND